MNVNPIDLQQLSEDYQTVEKAIQFLELNYNRQPGLEEVAQHVGFSEYHFQRLFTHWVGISPERFLQFLTKEYAKQMLEQSESLLDVAYQAGLSSPGRLHDLFVSCEAVTPGEYKKRGEGLTIHYGYHPTPFGECLLAVTERGICSLYFVEHNDRSDSIYTLHHRWECSRLVEDPTTTAPLIDRIFPLFYQPGAAPLQLYLSGTNFQIKVWEALLRIPQGRVVSYENVAHSLGMLQGARAVSRAVADNPIAYIIPCHRVIRKMGLMGGYRWGISRKKALLGWEISRELV